MAAVVERMGGNHLPIRRRELLAKAIDAGYLDMRDCIEGTTPVGIVPDWEELTSMVGADATVKWTATDSTNHPARPDLLGRMPMGVGGEPGRRSPLVPK